MGASKPYLEKNGKYFDGIRPAVEPIGLDSEKEVIEHRYYHISRVKSLFEKLDLFIFTLGLTEMWVHKESQTVYPTAPGTIAGEYNDMIYQFQNASFSEVIDDFNSFLEILKRIRLNRPFNILLTVSPVPLTATASGKHVLVSTTYSKSILRSAAGQLSSEQKHIDYFPSYEIVTNPRLHSTSFSENLRSVRDEAVNNVMNHFFSEHQVIKNGDSACMRPGNKKESLRGIQCEEALLEAFGNA